MNQINSVEDLKSEDLKNCDGPVYIDLTTEELEPAKEVLPFHFENCYSPIYIDDTTEEREPIKNSESILKQLLFIDSKNACEEDTNASERTEQKEDINTNEIKTDDEEFKSNEIKADYTQFYEDIEVEELQIKDEGVIDCDDNIDCYDDNFCELSTDTKEIEDNTDLEQKVYECKHCQKMFIAEDYLKKHLIVHREKQKLNAKRNVYECEHCQKTFVSEKYLNRHLTVHTKKPIIEETQRVYECTHCLKNFKSEKSLKQHLLVHSEMQLFECNVCFRNFRQKQHYTKHMSQHEEFAKISGSDRKFRVELEKVIGEGKKSIFFF